MLQKLWLLLSSFYFHGSQLKNKINDKVKNRTEKKMLCTRSTQPGYSHPSVFSCGTTFPTNIRSQ